ncbi:MULTISPECIES: ABC transporter permease [Virgibacillus]|nr:MULTISPECIES: ABC transporter permease [Virgibacillus]MEB5453794.1 ABC transporter permease [Virgibacillus pantothenticus]MEB5458031.1 ABC transporter permease [Virgibacillus pantothenticus]MEB5462214.1 ABC transporter permease [Virgibacillus pantothenticus]MEB5466255.1 ABC transporter permease [Virgibacillus pantothenticus]MEB5470615.1 ABC transporter permease [Virgibacillus pantothenticus]
MLKLIQNEQGKIFIRKSTWIMYIILAVLIFGNALLTNSFDGLKKDYQGDDWRQVLEEENKELQKEMEEVEGFEDYNNSLIAKNNYYLENDIQPAPYTAWTFVEENINFLSIVSLLTIIIAAGIVANEFRWGTIKLLLIRPISRSGILLSKYITVLLFALYTAIFTLVLMWIFGAIFFGIGDLNPSIVVEGEDGFKTVSLVANVFTSFGFKLVNLVMMATFAFMISAVFRNSSLAIGIAIFLMMGGSSIVTFFADKEWAKYILFAHTDLSQYMDGNFLMLEDNTMGFSITVLVVYYAIFMLLSWIVFTKRDVAGQ